MTRPRVVLMPVTPERVTVTPAQAAPVIRPPARGSQVVQVGIAGPAGPTGATGATGAADTGFIARLAQAAPVYSAVVSLPDGLYIANPDNPAHFGQISGVLMQSGRVGDLVRVAQAGVVPGWAGPVGTLWCGRNGQPVPSPPHGCGWRQAIAFSPASGSLVIQLRPAVQAD